MSNIHYFEITSLSFKIRTKIDVCTLAKPHAIFHFLFIYLFIIIFFFFLSEMLGFIHRFTAGNFNPKLTRGLEAISI